jgi:hypothetical protein
VRIFYNTIGGRDRDSNPPIINVSCPNYSRIQDQLKPLPRCQSCHFVTVNVCHENFAAGRFPIIIPFNFVFEDINSDAHLRCTTGTFEMSSGCAHLPQVINRGLLRPPLLCLFKVDQLFCKQTRSSFALQSAMDSISRFVSENEIITATTTSHPEKTLR